MLVAPAALGQRIEGIDRQRFAEFVMWLDLDEDQATLAWALHEDHQRAYDEEFLPIIRAYTSEMPGIQQRGYDEWRRAHKDEREAIDEEMKRRDEALFAGLEALLRPDQVERMRRVRFARQRQLLRTHRGELPGGNVDLAQFILLLDLSKEEEQQVFQVLDWYEPQLIAALERSWDAWQTFFRLSNEIADVQKQLDEQKALGNDAEVRALAKEHDDVKARRSRTMRQSAPRLLSLNQRALRALRAVLAEENGAEILRLYREEAYPEVWPDPVNAIVLYQAVETIETLSEEQKELIAAARTRFERAHEQMSEALAETFMDRRKGKAGFRDIFERGLEREALNAKQIEILRAILLPEQLAKLPEWDFEKNPPPRPWDWGNRIRREEAYRRIDELRQRVIEERRSGGGGRESADARNESSSRGRRVAWSERSHATA